jgi:hypothetical protein
MSTEAKWYVYRGKQYWGPYHWNQLHDMAQKGQIRPNEQLWNPQYSPNLIIANQVQGLFFNSPQTQATRINSQPFGCSDIIAILICIFMPGPAVFMAISYLVRRETIRGLIYLGLSLLFSCIWLVICASLGLLGDSY